MSLRWPYSKWMMRAIQVTVKQPQQPGIVISYNPWGISAVSTYYLYCVSYFLCCFRQIFYSLTEVLGFISYIRQLSYNSFCPRLNIRKSLHHAPPCSKYLKAQNKLIINYSNSCWGKKRGGHSVSLKATTAAIVQCLGSWDRRRQDCGQDLFLAKLQITLEKKTLRSSAKSSQATSVLKWQCYGSWKEIQIHVNAHALTWLQLMLKFHFSKLSRASFTHCLR